MEGASPPPAEIQRIWTLRLWGIAAPSLDRIVTVATAAALLLSRLFLLPSGPWEWDETLFARGILRFDLHAHFPHPPGFPLWLLLGRAVLPLVAEPLRGLQILSALASCLTLWPLAALGRRLAPPPVATAASLAVLLAPGVWLHAVRGFSSTPAAFFALWAAALAVHGLPDRRVTAFSLLVTTAFLVRPILLPPLALLWLVGVAPVRPLRRVVPGLALAVLAVGAAVVGMVIAQGSWHRFAAAFLTHGATHARNLERNVGGMAELGLVKGLGGVWPAASMAVLATIGLLAWRRAVGGRQAAAWVLVLVTATAQLLWLQNRTFPRYAVPVQLALAPLLAGGAACLAPPYLATAGIAAMAVLEGTLAFPCLREQHEQLMPGWQALREAQVLAEGRQLELVVEGGLYPFWSYLEEVERHRGRRLGVRAHLAPSSSDATTVPTGAYLLVSDFPWRYLAPPFGRTFRFAGVSERLRPLTQQRFLDAVVAEGAPLPLGGWWLPEMGADGERSMWGAPGARLLLPPYPRGTALRIDLCPAPGPAPIVVLVNDREALQIPGAKVRRAYWIEPRWLADDRTNVVTFARASAYPPGPRDPRRLSVRLFGLAGISAALPWEGPIAEARQRELLRIRVEGVFGPENFAHGRGAWTSPSARLWLPAGAGTLTLTTWAPRPGPPEVLIYAGDELLAGPFTVRNAPSEITFEIPPRLAGEDGVALTLLATPFYPARAGNPRDRRSLGIVLSHVRFRPAGRPPRATVAWLYPD